MAHVEWRAPSRPSGCPSVGDVAPGADRDLHEVDGKVDETNRKSHAIPAESNCELIGIVAAAAAPIYSARLCARVRIRETRATEFRTPRKYRISLEKQHVLVTVCRPASHSYSDCPPCSTALAPAVGIAIGSQPRQAARESCPPDGR